MSIIAEIIGKYTAGEKTLEETNAALKEAGVTEFHLEHMTEEELAAKRERERVLRLPPPKTPLRGGSAEGAMDCRHGAQRREKGHPQRAGL